MNEKLKKLTRKAKEVGERVIEVTADYAPLASAVAVTIVACKALNAVHDNKQHLRTYDEAWRRGFNEGGYAVLNVLKELDNVKIK